MEKPFPTGQILLIIFDGMDKTRHSNFIKASYLIFVMLLLGLIKYFYDPYIFANLKDILIAVFNIVFFLGLGLLLRQGFDWLKYVLLVLTVLGLINIQSRVGYVIHKPNLITIIVIIQRVILLIATILLFLVPKSVKYNTMKNVDFENEL